MDWMTRAKRSLLLGSCPPTTRSGNSRQSAAFIRSESLTYPHSRTRPDPLTDTPPPPPFTVSQTDPLSPYTARVPPDLTFRGLGVESPPVHPACPALRHRRGWRNGGHHLAEYHTACSLLVSQNVTHWCACIHGRYREVLSYMAACA